MNRFGRWTRRVLALVAAAIAALLVASLAHSLFVQQALREVGARIPPGTAVSTMVRDLLGLAPALGAVILIALTLGFLIAAVILRLVPQLSEIAWPLAGWAALATALWLMQLAYGFSPLAGARTAAGFIAISLGGAVGGWVFGRLAGSTVRPAST
ncbi:MAG: hypothetical protein ACK4MX_11690 [Thermaurantiacus sp.]